MQTAVPEVSLHCGSVIPDHLAEPPEPVVPVVTDQVDHPRLGTHCAAPSLPPALPPAAAYLASAGEADNTLTKESVLAMTNMYNCTYCIV